MQGSDPHSENEDKKEGAWMSKDSITDSYGENLSSAVLTFLRLGRLPASSSEIHVSWNPLFRYPEAPPRDPWRNRGVIVCFSKDTNSQPPTNSEWKYMVNTIHYSHQVPTLVSLIYTQRLTSSLNICNSVELGSVFGGSSCLSHPNGVINSHIFDKLSGLRTS